MSRGSEFTLAASVAPTNCVLWLRAGAKQLPEVPVFLLALLLPSPAALPASFPACFSSGSLPQGHPQPGCVLGRPC